MKIAYAINRTEKQLRAAGVVADKYFIDNDLSGLEERLDMMKAVRPGVTVYVMALTDFGRGRAAAKAVKSIERAGGRVEVIASDEPPGVGGRPALVDWPSEAALDDALVIWDALTAPAALAMIEKKYGLKVDRNHMNYQRRKRARAKMKQ